LGNDPETGDTILYDCQGWDKYPTDPGLFHENLQKQAINTENDWMVQLWTDGTYLDMNEIGAPGYEDYATHPIVFLSALTITVKPGQHLSK